MVALCRRPQCRWGEKRSRVQSTQVPDVQHVEVPSSCVSRSGFVRRIPKTKRDDAQADRGLYAEREVELFRKSNERGPDGFPEIEYKQLPVADNDPLEEQLRAFSESIHTGKRPMVGGEEGRRALEVATRVSELIGEQMERLGGAFGLDELAG